MIENTIIPIPSDSIPVQNSPIGDFVSGISSSTIQTLGVCQRVNVGEIADATQRTIPTRGWRVELRAEIPSLL